jgi:hypothetical protein
VVGTAITALNATNLTSGTVDPARLNNTYVPAGAVMDFNLGACPTGWTEYTAARGLYVVGLPAGGTLAGSPVGQTALTDKQNRAAGIHSHTGSSTAPTINDPGHVHVNSVTHQGGVGSVGGSIAGSVTDSTSSAATGITTNAPSITVNDNTGTAGTNAPYIQLLKCTKS